MKQSKVAKKTTKAKSKPLFVEISDVHYSLSTLELADKSFRAAIDKAAELGIPLVDGGDLTNDKAILRGEVINRLLQTFQYAKSKHVEIYCLIGNHSLVNEKGSEHVLNFLEPYAYIIDEICGAFDLPNVTFIPYQNDPGKLQDIIQSINPGRILVMHQGFQGAAMGDYIVDKTSIPIDAVKDFTVISGHYHRHQTIGTVTYVGNPYTLSFGEANDGPKGFIIVNEDGSFTREILDLRQHMIIETTVCNILENKPTGGPFPEKDDLVWVKLRGTTLELAKIKKVDILGGHMNFKLDKIPTDEVQLEKSITPRTDDQIMDALIDSGNDTVEQKTQLKALWREVVQ